MKSAKLVKRIIMIVCLIIIMSYLLPFAYFLAFPATDETSRQATKLPKGIIVEFCFYVQDFSMGLVWAAPGTFAVSIHPLYFARCGYLPWLPFVKLPEHASLGIPGWTFKWDKYCFGECP